MVRKKIASLKSLKRVLWKTIQNIKKSGGREFNDRVIFFAKVFDFCLGFFLGKWGNAPNRFFQFITNILLQVLSFSEIVLLFKFLLIRVHNDGDPF